MSESQEQAHHRAKLVAHLLLVALAVYVVFIQLQSIYFGAFFFGQQPPAWLAFVADLPAWTLDVIATVGVLIVLGLLLVARYEHMRPGRRLANRRGGSAVAAVIAILALLALLAVLNLGFGITLQSLIGGLRGFFSGL